jgi:putative thioredoxin
MNETSSPWVRDVAEADFEREVVAASHQQPVVVDFWAPWCGPCRLLGPMLEQLVAKRKGEVVLAKINVDEAPRLASELGVSAIPAVKAFRDGRLIHAFEGVLPEASLQMFLDSICPTDADRLVQEARGLEVSKPADAERLYRQAIEQQRNHEEARVGLARVLLAQNKTEDIEDLLAPVGTEGEVGAEAERLKAQVYFRRLARDFGNEAAARKRLEANPTSATAAFEFGCVLAAKGDYPAALERLLAAAERDPKLAANKVREVMVKIFYALGVQHPLANEYRGKLSRLLY